MRTPAVLLLAAVSGLAEDAPNLARVSPPAARVTVKEAIETGVAWLVRNQNKDGSFGKMTSGRPWGVSAAVPGGIHAFRAATTALAWMGLHDAPHQPPESKTAQKRALAWLVKNVRVKRAHPGELYNTWSFGFGLQAIARALRSKAPGASEEELRKVAAELVKAHATYQTPDGGWGYYDFRTRTYRPSWSTSFTTATSLVALRDAEIAGVAVPPPVLTRAANNVALCRKPDGTYLYGTYMRYSPNHGVNKPQGASLRVQACNLALRKAGSKITDDDLRAGLAMLEKHHRFAIAGLRRPIPHESHYAVSGYFYLYGYVYAALTLEHLPEKDRRRYAPEIARSVLKARQPDGSYWDYPLYGFHKAYGTGFALMALSRCGE